MSTVYLDGEYLPLDDARISPLDRGFLFADGVYEVVPVYAGRLFRIEEHMVRLSNSLAAVRIETPNSTSQWTAVLQGLVERNGGGNQSVYLQVTRGVAPRNPAFPPGVSPTVFAMTRKIEEESPIVPARAVTRPDFRWGRCDIKSIALLGNVLLRQEAVDAGATETILLRDALVTEGAASNVFVVDRDGLRTPANGPYLLPGITRDLVLELSARAQPRCREGDITESELRGADEIWITSSTMEVTPVVTLDGRPVGSGHPGPVWERIHAAFQDFKRHLMAG